MAASSRLPHVPSVTVLDARTSWQLRVEPLPAGQRDDADGGNNAEGRPDIGEQVAPLGLDGDRTMHSLLGFAVRLRVLRLR